MRNSWASPSASGLRWTHWWTRAWPSPSNGSQATPTSLETRRLTSWPTARQPNAPGQRRLSTWPAPEPQFENAPEQCRLPAHTATRTRSSRRTTRTSRAGNKLRCPSCGQGTAPLTRATLHRLDLASDPLCRECGAEDTVRHLLTECPAFASTRCRLWGGPVPSLDDVLSGPAGKILDYIRRVGRSEPPLGQPPPDAPAGASAWRARQGKTEAAAVTPLTPRTPYRFQSDKLSQNPSVWGQRKESVHGVLACQDASRCHLSSSVPAVRMHSSSLPSRILERVYRAWRVCRGVMKRIYRGVVWWQRLATGVPRRYHRQSEWTVSIFQVPARCGVVPARSLNVIIIRWPCHVSDGHCDNRSAGDSALLYQSCCNVCVLHEKCKTCLWSLKVIQPGLCSTHFFGLTRLWLIWQSRWLNSDSTQIPNLLTWLKSDSTQNPNLLTWFKSDSTH